MKRTRTNNLLVAFVALALLSWTTACGDDDDGMGGGDTGTTDVTDMMEDNMADGADGADVVDDTGTDTAMDTMADQGDDTGQDTTPGNTMFQVRVENIANGPLPLAPGVWAVHTGSEPLFTAGSAASAGLERLAEDGDPGMLSEMVAAAGIEQGVFAIPDSGTDPGPLFPGDAYTFTVETNEATPYLSFASMFVQSNDLFLATASGGLDLFPGGTPTTGDVTDQIALWDAGTERNQAPGHGLTQAPRQSGPNTGAGEGVIGAWQDTTRALPAASGLVEVSVTEMSGTYTVTLTNVSRDVGAFMAPFAPAFYATHNGSWSLFTEGEAAPAELEMLAEDGSPAGLVTLHTGGSDVGMVGAADTPVGEDAPGPIFPGGAYTFDVTPTMEMPHLTIALMLVESNDLFLSTGPMGVALYDGGPRAAADVQADLHAALAVWDAGTEANQVPGFGPDQAPRQAAANTGDADPVAMVRHYDDDTNDLDSSTMPLNGYATVTVAGAGGLDFDVVVANTSGDARPGAITPVLWVIHDDTLAGFEMGAAASAGLETLAEDGDPTALLAELNSASGVLAAGVSDTPTGAGEAGPAFGGQDYAFSVTADATHRNLSVFSMVVPSNDTFLAFAPTGVTLVDEGTGSARTDAAISSDIAASLQAWDAGTEANQGGAHGRDMAPFQDGPNTGASEGDATVRPVADPVWLYPAPAHVVRVTVTPL